MRLSIPRPLFAATCTRPGATVALLVAGLLAGLTALPAAAQWKWRDASGQITASDRPPPKEVPEKDILSRPTTTPVRRFVPPPVEAASAPAAGATASPTGNATGNAPARGSLEGEVDARRRAAEQEAVAKARAEEQKAAQQRAENCRRARSHLAALESGQRMARVNERGEREVLDDKGRVEEMRAAREVITSECR